MTEISPVYGDPENAAARLARVFAATGCSTWADLADFLSIPITYIYGPASGGAPGRACAQRPTAAVTDAAVLCAILRCIPASYLQAELARRRKRG